LYQSMDRPYQHQHHLQLQIDATEEHSSLMKWDPLHQRSVVINNIHNTLTMTVNETSEPSSALKLLMSENITDSADTVAVNDAPDYSSEWRWCSQYPDYSRMMHLILSIKMFKTVYIFYSWVYGSIHILSIW
jgi:hypothetical protein